MGASVGERPLTPLLCPFSATNHSVLSQQSLCPVSTTKELFSSFTDLITKVEGSNSLAEWNLLTEYQHESSIFFFTFAFTEV